MYDYGPQLNKRVGWNRGLQFLPDVASHALVPAVLPVSARPLRLDGELPGCEIGPSLVLDGRQLVVVEFRRDFAGVILIAQPVCCACI